CAARALVNLPCLCQEHRSLSKLREDAVSNELRGSRTGKGTAGTQDCAVSWRPGSVERGGQKHFSCKEAFLCAGCPGRRRAESGADGVERPDQRAGGGLE